MLFRGQLDGESATVSLKPTSISVAIDHKYVAAWDLGGRLYTVWRFGHTYRRGLDGKVLHKWRDPEAAPDAAGPYDERQRMILSAEEARRLLDETAALARAAASALTSEPAGWPMREGPKRWLVDADGARHAVLEALQPCLAFDADAAEADSRRFASVYHPIGILPPDQYMSLVLQGTHGCSFGSCTFCDLYHEPYMVRSADDFAAHIEAVLRYLGPSAALRSRAVFLGAANALAVPMPRLIEFLSAIRSTLPTPVPVHAFVDAFTGVKKSLEDYRELAARGLRRVYIGLESGHDPLLAFVRKPGTREQAVDTVGTLKAAGLSVGVIVMVGLGGRRYDEAHVADTVAALNAMPLDEQDLVYFSELVEVEATPYPRIAAEEELGTLDMRGLARQRESIRRALVFRASAPRFARYDVREFVY